MKKTLIALAALAAAGATLAQSSVTIYGRMDLGMSQFETTDSVGGTVRAESFSLAGAEGTRTGSRLGFRGTEDLGGGLRAGFVYEIGINADRVTSTGLVGNADSVGGTGFGDNVNQPANAATRLANLSLSGGFGTVVIGTFMNAFDTVRGYSPATANAPGGDFTLSHGDALTQRFDSRTQNAIAYVSPAFNGFTVSAGFVNEDHGVAPVDRADRKYDGFILGLGYSHGPLAAQFVLGQLDVTHHNPLGINANTITNGEVDNWALGVRYTLPQVVLSFIYEDSELSAAAVGTLHEHKAWEIGARFPMGAFAPYITFGDGEIRQGGPTRDTSSWQIGTTYNLSNRTFVYAAYGKFEGTHRSDGDLTTQARETTGFALGIVHNF